MGYLPDGSSAWAVWLREQRSKLKDGVLDDAQTNALYEAGVSVKKGWSDSASRAILKGHLESLAKYQEKRGRGSCPNHRDKAFLRTYGYFHHLEKQFYLNKLSEDIINDLYQKYGLQFFNPNKVSKIQEVNELSLADLRSKCKANGFKVARVRQEQLVVQLLKYIFRPAVRFCLLLLTLPLHYYSQTLTFFQCIYRRTRSRR